MSAHEEDASRPCPECGVTFDIHSVLGTCSDAVGSHRDPSSSIKEPVTQASEEAMKRIDAWYAIGLLDIETADDPDFVRAVEAYGHECSRQALERAAQKLESMRPEHPCDIGYCAEACFHDAYEQAADEVRALLSDGESVASAEKEE